MEHMDSKEMRLAEAEHAVIKAAVALRSAEKVPGTHDRYFAVHAAKQVFNDAVRALIAEEGGQ